MDKEGNGKSTYGYKNHIGIDREHKLIRTYEVSDASVHDSVMTHELVEREQLKQRLFGQIQLIGQER